MEPRGKILLYKVNNCLCVEYPLQAEVHCLNNRILKTFSTEKIFTMPCIYIYFWSKIRSNDSVWYKSSWVGPISFFFAKRHTMHCINSWPLRAWLHPILCPLLLDNRATLVERERLNIACDCVKQVNQGVRSTFNCTGQTNGNVAALRIYYNHPNVASSVAQKWDLDSIWGSTR